MPRLSYCYLGIFGAGLDVDGLKAAIGDPDATVHVLGRRVSPEPRSSIPALQKGGVREWKSPRRYYVASNAFPPWDFTAEENFVCQYLSEWLGIRDVLPRFRTDTTEVWLHLIYQASESERPTGVFFSRRLLDVVHEIGASISTDVTIEPIGE